MVLRAHDQGHDVDPLDELRDSVELVTLLSGWRWRAMKAAREQGASWSEIVAPRGCPEQAESVHSEAIERQRARCGAEGLR